MRILCVLFLCCVKLTAQQVYWVQLKNKDSTYSINKPQQFLSSKAIARRNKFNIPIAESDLPISESYLNQFSAKNILVLSKSKWLNGVALVVPNKLYVDTLKQFIGVSSVKYLGEYKRQKQPKDKSPNLNEMLTVLDSRFEEKQKRKLDSNIYGKTFKQVSMLNTHLLHNQGYKGEGIDVAIIDAGFNNANMLPVFTALFNQKRVKGTYDFVARDYSVFDDDDHGMAVLSCMAGNISNEFIGTAPAANYYLLRSENALTETPIEEYYWIEAIEYADSVGVDLVNSSLGYNEFDDASFNHNYKEFDGKTINISKVASMAVKKGLVVLVSAGNDGDGDWKFISAPADAKEVITVGGVDIQRKYVSFSSIGPTADKHTKPDVMAQGENVWVASNKGVFYQGDGTSYSCPLMAGSVACLMQAHPTKTPMDIMQALHLSGSNYYNPNDYIGYGIPDMQLANLLLTSDTAELVLDACLLQDKRVHISVTVSQPQKVVAIWRDALDQIVFTETVLFKKSGVNRVGLKKNKQLKKGIYSLQIIGKSFSTSQTITLL